MRIEESAAELKRDWENAKHGDDQAAEKMVRGLTRLGLLAPKSEWPPLTDEARSREVSNIKEIEKMFPGAKKVLHLQVFTGYTYRELGTTFDDDFSEEDHYSDEPIVVKTAEEVIRRLRQFRSDKLEPDVVLNNAYEDLKGSKYIRFYTDMVARRHGDGYEENEVEVFREDGTSMTRRERDYMTADRSVSEAIKKMCNKIRDLVADGRG